MVISDRDRFVDPVAYLNEIHLREREERLLRGLLHKEATPTKNLLFSPSSDGNSSLGESTADELDRILHPPRDANARPISGRARRVCARRRGASAG